MSDPEAAHPRRPAFPTTRWSRVVAAGDPAAPEARAALAELCAAYWYPLYAFIRRKGHDPDEALDLTQDYFARLLETRRRWPRPTAARAASAPSCGPTAASSWPTSRERDRALKRGGGAAAAVDRRPRRRGPLPPRAGRRDLTPERLFDRAWALSLLDGVLERLAARVRRARAGPRSSSRSRRDLGRQAAPRPVRRDRRAARARPRGPSSRPCQPAPQALPGDPPRARSPRRSTTRRGRDRRRDPRPVRRPRRADPGKIRRPPRRVRRRFRYQEGRTTTTDPRGGPDHGRADRCPSCGAALPAHAPGGLCPRCLLRAGPRQRRPSLLARRRGRRHAST